MRFRFCGDLDCPDWVLAEISTLSRLTSVKMRLLCIQVLKGLLEETLDYEKVGKLTSDAKFEAGDVKATIAVLEFIISSAAKYSVDGQSLSSELQQLGLPKGSRLTLGITQDRRTNEHAVTLCKCYEDKLGELQGKLKAQSMRLSRLAGVAWRVDYILSSSELLEVNEPSVQLKLNVQDGMTSEVRPVSFTMTNGQLHLMLMELKQALKMMDDVF
uniref:COMM domain-containing protein 4-like isoform X1 n=1 Tax=Myxine glutinosa TaxID=7769 RepID=UPI00358E9939